MGCPNFRAVVRMAERERKKTLMQPRATQILTPPSLITTSGVAAGVDLGGTNNIGREVPAPRPWGSVTPGAIAQTYLLPVRARGGRGRGRGRPPRRRRTSHPGTWRTPAGTPPGRRTTPGPGRRAGPTGSSSSSSSRAQPAWT